jgi:hypothetical protein
LQVILGTPTPFREHRRSVQFPARPSSGPCREALCRRRFQQSNSDF